MVVSCQFDIVQQLVSNCNSCCLSFLSCSFRTVLPLSLTDISNEKDELFSLTTKRYVLLHVCIFQPAAPCVTCVCTRFTSPLSLFSFMRCLFMLLHRPFLLLVQW